MKELSKDTFSKNLAVAVGDLTHVELAQKLDKSKVTVDRWFSPAADSMPTLKDIAKISEVLDVSIDSLLGLPGAEENKRPVAKYLNLDTIAVNTLHESGKLYSNELNNILKHSSDVEKILKCLYDIHFNKVLAEFTNITRNDNIESSPDQLHLDNVLVDIRRSLPDIRKAEAVRHFANLLDKIYNEE